MGRYELDYPPIEVDRIKKTILDRIIVQWEENTNTMAGGKLIRPDTYKKQYYTGIVLKVGDYVDPELKEGDRILFDQFSGFEKFYDEKHGRIAILEERKQGPAFAVIPKRIEVDSEEDLSGLIGDIEA